MTYFKKQGNIRDIALFGVLLFVFAVMGLVMFYIANTMKVSLLANEQINSSANAVTSIQATDNATSRIDYLFSGIFVGLLLALMISGWYIGGEAIFMFIYIIVTVISVAISMVLSNVWVEIAQTPTFMTTANTLVITNHIMNLLPVYVSVAAFIGIIAMFAKPALR